MLFTRSIYRHIVNRENQCVLSNSIGEFGHVYKGKLTLEDGKSILVAAKTLKVLQRMLCISTLKA